MPEPPTHASEPASGEPTQVEAPTIGVVVVAYRSAPTLAGCLAGILGDPGVVAVVVQDNSADEATRAVVATQADERVHYVADTNVGFAAGCNRGVERLGRPVEWLAFVNPDVSLERPLSELVRRSTARSGRVLGAQVESPRSPGTLSARQAVTRRRELLKAAFGPRVYALRASGTGGAEVIHVAQVSGALLMVRRSDFESWGGFDTRFELYYEDVDLCARSPGGCFFVTQRWGSHVGGASSASGAEVSGAAYVAGRVSRVRYLRKHFPGPTTEATLVLAAAVEVVTRSVGRAAEGPAARWAGLRAQARELLRPGTEGVLRSLDRRDRRDGVAVSGPGRP